MNRIEELAAKYVLLELSSEERSYLASYLKESNEHRKEFKKLVKAYRLSQAQSLQVNVEKDWRSVQNQLRKGKVRMMRTWSYLAGAASIVLLMALSLFLMQDQLSLFAPEMAEITTDSLQQKKIKLQDGSLVWLNRNSKLRFPKEFGEELREVELEGEAYFEVARDTSRSFKIQTDYTLTEVLGTSFNIRSYPEAEQDLIQVYTGKVSYSAGKEESLILTPNMEAAFQRRGQHLHRLKQFNPNQLAWKTKAFKFDSVKLEQVMKDLSHAYASEIVFDTKDWNEVLVTTRFEKLGLIECLDILSESLGFEYELSENIVRIK